MRLFDNIPLKLASLGLAMLLWYVIAGEKTSEIGLSVPVELQNFPKELELTGEPVNSVEVRLRATPGVIQRLGPGDIAAQLDLVGIEEGERIVHLTPDNIRVPFGVKVVKINPALMRLNLERTLQRVVPVRPRLLGRPAAGHEVAEVTSTPAEVRIAGPKSRVQEVESAFTEPVSVEGATSTVTDDVNIGLEDPLLRIQVSPRVKVSVKIQELQEKRIFDGLLLEVRGGSATVLPARVRVVLEGPSSAVRGLTPADVRPYVELGTTSGPRAPVAVELRGPAGVSIHHTEPADVALHNVRKGP
jgi:YbbR domain-containing protein